LPNSQVRFRLPAQCKYCAAAGTVTPEHTIKGDSVTLTWCCRRCGREWPITAAEQHAIDRRTGQPDRRRSTRVERRGRRQLKD
jgi:hypothetical protein